LLWKSFAALSELNESFGGRERKGKKNKKKREKKGEVREKLGKGKRWLRPL
jgi:hypothetical protein